MKTGESSKEGETPKRTIAKVTPWQPALTEDEPSCKQGRVDKSDCIIFNVPSKEEFPFSMPDASLEMDPGIIAHLTDDGDNSQSCQESVSSPDNLELRIDNSTEKDKGDDVIMKAEDDDDDDDVIFCSSELPAPRKPSPRHAHENSDVLIISDDEDSSVPYACATKEPYSGFTGSTYLQKRHMAEVRFGSSDIPSPSQYEEVLQIIQVAKKPISCEIARLLLLMRQELGGKYPIHEWNMLEPPEFSREIHSEIWNRLMAEAVTLFVPQYMNLLMDMPGIHSLQPEDMQLLAQNSLFEFWQLVHSPLWTNDDMFVRLKNGARISRKWCDYFFKTPIYFNENYEYSTMINSFKLTDVEQILLSMIQLTLIDRSLVKDHDAVVRLNDLYEELLLYSLTKTHPGQTGRIIGRIHEALIPKMYELRKLRIEHVDTKTVTLPPDIMADFLQIPGGSQVKNLTKYLRHGFNL